MYDNGLLMAHCRSQLSQVIEEGAWSEAVGSAVSKRGVQVLGTARCDLCRALML